MHTDVQDDREYKSGIKTVVGDLIMKSTTRAVVIGDGIAGCSALYHLTREGWSDVVLIERDELTSGTTWHSAAQVTNFGMNQTMVGLKSHSIAL